MKFIIRGDDRTVFVFRRFGFVVKLPRMHWRTAATVVYYCAKHRHLYSAWGENNHQYHTVRFCLIRGLWLNWHEFKFYQYTRHPFVQPTYFSLLGLLNIQAYGEPTALSDGEIWAATLRVTSTARSDGHHFMARRNFCSAGGGTTKLLDYGSDRTQKIICAHGAQIQRELEKISAQQN